MSFTCSVQYLALVKTNSYGQLMYSLICADIVNIYCNVYNFTRLDRFIGSYDFGGIIGNTTSTLKVPLLPVGLLLRLLS